MAGVVATCVGGVATGIGTGADVTGIGVVADVVGDGVVAAVVGGVIEAGRLETAGFDTGESLSTVEVGMVGDGLVIGGVADAVAGAVADGAADAIGGVAGILASADCEVLTFR